MFGYMFYISEISCCLGIVEVYHSIEYVVNSQLSWLFITNEGKRDFSELNI